MGTRKEIFPYRINCDSKKRDVRQIVRIMRKNGYVINRRPFELNIVGIRSKSTIPNSFDDMLTLFWYDERGKLHFKSFCITTDPGTFYIKNPIGNYDTGSGVIKATAILKEGQYVNAYQIGMHREKYKALVQKENVTVYRKWDRQAVFFLNDQYTDTGKFGINIHRARKSGETEEVDLHSAGCQVFAKADDFLEFLDLCERHRNKYDNEFTYTLIDEYMQSQQKVRQGMIIGGGFALLCIAGLIIYRKSFKK